MSDIVVGYDGSDCARAALTAAAELAKAFDDKVVLVFGYAPGGYGGGEVPSQRDAVRELAEKATSAGVSQAKAAGVEAEVENVNKHPAQALIDVAAERGARMIVVGTRGESPLKGVVIGSTPYKLLHLSEVPVLIVPA
jgi:nucleotide-binding universal stress UspA family protein